MEDVGAGGKIREGREGFGPPLFHRKMRRVSEPSPLKKQKVPLVGPDGQI